MELFASLMKGYTPILIFIFLCFASLLVMFMKLLRSLEEMLHGLSGDRNAIVQQLTQIKEQLEHIARQQAEGASLRKSGAAPESVASYGPSTPPSATELGAAFSSTPGQTLPFPSGPSPEGAPTGGFSLDQGTEKSAGAWGAGAAVGAAALAGAAVGVVAASAGGKTDPDSALSAAAAKEFPAKAGKGSELSLEEAEQAATEELVFSMDERLPPPRPAGPTAKSTAPAFDELDLGESDLAETLDLSQFTANGVDLSFIEEPAASEAEEPETLEDEELQFDLGIEPEPERAAAPKAERIVAPVLEEEGVDLLGLEIETPKKGTDQEDMLSFDSDLLLDDTLVEGVTEPSPRDSDKESAFSLDEISFDDSSDNIDIDLSSSDDKELDLLVEDLVDVPDDASKDRAGAAEDEAPYEEAEVILDDEEPETELDILLDGPDERRGPADMDDELEFSLDLETDEAPRRSGVKDLQLENLELLSEKDLAGEPFAMSMPSAPAAKAAKKPEPKPMADDEDEIDLLDFTIDDLATPQPDKGAAATPASKPKDAKAGKESNLVDFILDE